MTTDDARDLVAAASVLRATDAREASLRQLEELLATVQSRVRSIAQEPTAFIQPGGGYDAKMLTAWNGLVGSCSKLLGQISDIRNQDEQLSRAIRETAIAFGQAISGPLGVEMREAHARISALETQLRGNIATREECAASAAALREWVHALLTNRMIEILNGAASITVRTTNEAFGR